MDWKAIAKGLWRRMRYDRAEADRALTAARLLLLGGAHPGECDSADGGCSVHRKYAAERYERAVDILGGGQFVYSLSIEGARVGVTTSDSA